MSTRSRAQPWWRARGPERYLDGFNTSRAMSLGWKPPDLRAPERFEPPLLWAPNIILQAPQFNGVICSFTEPPRASWWQRLRRAFIGWMQGR